MSVVDPTSEIVDRLIALPADEQLIAVRAMTEVQRREFFTRWDAWAHGGQLAPPGDWRVWVIRAGRGFGKTRAGAEWVTQLMRETPDGCFALVGATVEDVRKVMVEGPSGVIAVAANHEERPTWQATSGTVTWPNGATAQVYAASAPEKLRGPEHHAAWCDELGKWGRGGNAAWDNLTLTLRAGERARVLVTTTPRPTDLLRRVLALPTTVETAGRTKENPHLPDSFVEAMAAQYGGTRLGRQELDGELLEDAEGALWTRALLERQRVRAAPELVRVVVGVDPPAGGEKAGDACGIVAVGRGRDGHDYVLEDASVGSGLPEVWARAVAACAARHGADRVVAEANQGGKMVRSVLAAADNAMPVLLVRARDGKVARAEPVSLRYEAGRVWHVGAWPALEDELCGLVVGGGYHGPGRSPDRADALVWAVSELLRPRRVGRVRGLV